MENPDFKKLQADVSESLSKAQRGRRIMQCIQIPTYIVSFGWVLFVPVAGVFLGGMDGASDLFQDSWSWLLTIVVVFMVAAGGMSWAYNYFNKKEDEVMKHLVTTLFPTAKYHKTPRGVNRDILKSSRLFNSSKNANLAVQAYGSMEIPVGDRKLMVADIGIIDDDDKESVDGYLMLLRMLLRMVSGGRADSAITNFRGMFTWVDMEKTLPGIVIILPDHLEGKLGYLAQNIQSLSNSRSEKLVTMEDPAFEKHYAVYASDEVLARYVLTPAMMVRLTQLRERFGRDVMISFVRNRFCCAVASPDGFFALRPKAIREGRFVEEIYNDISAAVALSSELRLDKMVKN